MQRSTVVALTLTLLTLAGGRVHADVEPDSFHYSMHPVATKVKSFEFNIERGRWTATLQTGDNLVSDEGKMDEADRNKFFAGLERSGAWRLQSTAQTVADQPTYRYLVTHRKDQHEAEFSGTPSADYGKLLQYLQGSVVGHEQEVLTQKLGAATAPGPIVSTAAFIAVTSLGAVVAGFLGSLTGLGGGVVIVPLLVLLLGVDMHYASGASLVSVIATSSGAAVAYVREGYSNLRVGMLLEVATTIGALVGAHLAAHMSANVLAVVLGVVLMISAVASARHVETAPQGPPDPVGERLHLNNSYPNEAGEPTAYHVRRVPLGFALMSGAGAVSGLLGIGSGALKVLAMDLAMGLPFKVSTTTSNFMIGVTAAASIGIYLRHGFIEPVLAAPVTLGVLVGSWAGSRLLGRSRPEGLRRLFVVVVGALAIEMIYRGASGQL